MRAFAMANVNKDGLVRLDEEIKRITNDLQIPMLTDIRRAQTDIRTAIQEVQAREVGDGFDAKAMQSTIQLAIDRELDRRSAQGRRSVRDIIEAKVASAAAAEPARGSGVADQLMFRLGRVRFDILEEGEEVLGEGGFGIVTSGEYNGEEVAIKKTKAAVGDPAVLDEFRCVSLRFSTLRRAPGWVW